MAESPKHGNSSSQLKPESSLRSNTLEQNTPALELIANSYKIKIIKEVLTNEKLYLVGGTVRDILSGDSNVDMDLATSLNPQKAIKLFTAKNIRVIPTGIQHGTITVVIDEENIEITTFRKPESRENFSFSETIEEDLSGRDFTINAIAFDLDTLNLIDPFNGLEDLNANILRAVKDPNARFKEDPLRILRMVRFGTASNRTIDKATFDSAKKNVELLKKVTNERIRKELCEILQSKDVISGFNTLKDINAFPFILPEIIPAIGFEQNEFHTHDVYEHTLWVIDRTPKENLKLRLSALFHDLGKPHTLSIGDDGRRHFYEHEVISAQISESVMTRLKFSNKEIVDVKNIVALHMRPIDCGPSGVRRLMRDLGDNFIEWREFKSADSPPVLGDDDFKTRAKKFDDLVEAEKLRLETAKNKKLAINGDDLKKLGLPEGREIGIILKKLEEIVIEDPSQNEFENLMNKVKEFREHED